MTRTRAQVEVQLQKARQDFMVETWPAHLQRASKIERKLLALMPDPHYQLHVDNGSVGKTLHLVTRGTFVNGRHPAWRFIEKHEEELIAWVEHTEAINDRIRKLEEELWTITSATT